MPLSSTFNLGVLARTKNSMHPRGSRYPSSPVPPLYPMHTRGPLRPLPDGVPHRVVDAWRDLRVWGGVDVEVGGLRPPPPRGGGGPPGPAPPGGDGGGRGQFRLPTCAP